MKNQVLYMLYTGKTSFCSASVPPSPYHRNGAFVEEKSRKPDAHHTFYPLHASCLKKWKYDNEKKRSEEEGRARSCFFFFNVK